MTARNEVALRIRGLYGLADASAAHDGDPIALGAHMLEGGCRLLQLRCKGWSSGEVLRAGHALARRCRAVGATFVVNDLPEVAVAVNADGVHVGQTDGASAAIRAVIGEGRILGRSTNDPGAVPAAVAKADYVAFGPMYDTVNLSRPKAVQGPALLAQIRASVAGMPLVAIGGITLGRLPEVRAAGADAWAVIGAIAGAEDPVAATRALLP